MAKQGQGQTALMFVKKYFPNVVAVVDAKQGIKINVTKADCKAGRRKDSNNCALAKACRRQHIADAAIIGISTSYLIKNNVAIRFKTSQAVGREITSFDRHQDFAAGKDYLLSPIAPALRLNAQKHRGSKSYRGAKMGPRKRTVHRTTRIRKIG